MLRTIYKFRNLDATRDMNDRYRDLIQKGIFLGGSVVPVTGQLKVDVAPFKLVSYDGLVVIETSDIQRLTVVAGQNNVVCLKARYIDNDNVQTEWAVFEETVFNALTDKAYYIIFAKINLSVGATQVFSTDINYTDRDILDPIGRSPFRGTVQFSSDLPLANNRVGDYYIVAHIGVTPSIFGWNGSSWDDLTTAVSISSLLSRHRQNLFANEKHLTDLQQQAAAGTAGTPSGTNRYVTEADYRLPTIPIRDALNGSDGTPNAANRYITQSFPFAVPTEISFTPPITPSVEMVAAYGPIYVGTGGTGTATQWFNLYDGTQDAELVNNDLTRTYVMAVFTDSGLTQELNPATNAFVDALGYLSGASLFLSINQLPDNNFKVSYGKRKTLKTAETNFLLERGPKFAQADWRIFSLQNDFDREIAPLRTTADGIDAIIQIEAAVGQRQDGTKLIYTLPDSSQQLDLSAAQVDFSNGTISGASGSFSAFPPLAPYWYAKAGLAVMPAFGGATQDTLEVVWGIPAPTESGLSIPLWNSDTVPFAIVTLQDNGSATGSSFGPIQQNNIEQIVNPFLVTKVYNEEIEVTSSSGQSFFAYPNGAYFVVGSDQVIVFVNGDAKSIDAGDYIEVGGSAVQFAYDIPYLGRVRFWSAKAVPMAGGLSSTGITWATPVNANIIPDSNLTWDLGRPDRKFKDVYIGGKLTVDGLIDPIGIQFTSTGVNPLSGPGFYVDMATGTVRARDDNANNIAVTTTDGHINTEANIQKDGISIRTDVQTINFVGSGVSIANMGPKAVEISITGGGSGGISQIDGGSSISVYTLDAQMDGGNASSF